MTRNLRLFVTGQITTSLGSTFTAIAIPLIAVRYAAASPARIGLLTAAGTVPLLGLGLFLSAWVDRRPRRRPILVASELIGAAAVGWLIVDLLSGALKFYELIVLVFILGTLQVIVQSAYFAHLRSLVDEGEVLKARASLQRGEQLGGLLGRICAGPAVVLGLFVPFLLDALSYLLSAGCLLLIRTPEAASADRATGRVTRAELGAGIIVLRRTSFLRQITPFTAGQQFVSGITLAALPGFLVTVLGIPTSVYGLVFVLAGVAGVLGTTIARRLADTVEVRALTVFGLIGIAVSAVLLPLARGPVATATFVAALGLGLPVLFGAIANVGMTGFVTSVVPQEKLGRAATTLQMISGVFRLGGALIGGLLATHIGIRPTLWVGAAVSLLAVGTLLPAFRALRGTPGHPAPRGAPTSARPYPADAAST